MAVSRVEKVNSHFKTVVSSLQGPPLRSDLHAPVKEGSPLTATQAIGIFTAQVESRILDMLARELKVEGQSFYTIGSSGHEGNASVAAALRPTDPAFLHYRSGGFFLARSQQVPGNAGAFDVLLGMVASRDEPIAGGRHKVFGSVELCIPPQTSTIASHLPKALGCAVAIDRKARMEQVVDERIVVCTFGDASSNHASATTAFNAASWTSHQNVPAPVLFVCEDNGLGISVRTPQDWVSMNQSNRHGMKYFYANGRDLVETYSVALLAAQFVRKYRKPAFLHVKTVRLLGHAGSDVEQLYRTEQEIHQNELLDPLLAGAKFFIRTGWMSAEDVLELYESTYTRLSALAREAVTRPKIESADEVMEPLFTQSEETPRLAVAHEEARTGYFTNLPEKASRDRHLAFQLNRALGDILLAYENAIIFGEDVAKKGGVYHVTSGLTKKFGVGRVFNTLLDETTILGLAMGAGHAGFLPIPEIQYLAYLINAIDQIRGEAASMQFFSQGQYHNPMVVRIASLAYQKGFGGHFHNDNGIAALREIPGLLIGCPARGDDAARMLRTMVHEANENGRVCVHLEPIALYMTKDLYEDGDGKWLTSYPDPMECMPFGEVGTYGDGEDICVLSYANGLWMSLRVVERLKSQGIHARVVDIRWLQPLPLESLIEQIGTRKKIIIVDECRQNSGIANELAASLWERLEGVSIRRVQAANTYIPLGAAANMVLVQEHDIEHAILEMTE